MAHSFSAPYKHTFHSNLSPSHPSCQREIDATGRWGDLSSSRPRARPALGRLSRNMAAADQLDPLDGVPGSQRQVFYRCCSDLLWGVEGLGLDGEITALSQPH